MRFIWKSFKLGILAAPFVMVIMLMYGFIGGGITYTVSLVVAFVVTVFPQAILVTIVMAWFAHSAMLLGAVRPAVQLAGFGSQLKFLRMLEQTLKLLMIRMVLYLILAIGTFILVYLILGEELVDLVSANDPQTAINTYVTALFSEIAGGYWPSIFTFFLAFMVLVSALEAFIAVPTAAAGFASGKEGVRARVLSGFGFKYLSVFAAMLLFELFIWICVVLLIGSALAGVSFGMVLHYLQSVVFGGVPNWTDVPEFVAPSPTEAGFTLIPAVLLVYFGRASFWAATCATAYKAWMDQAGQTPDAPVPPVDITPKGVGVDVRDLRQSRMPKG